MKRAGNLRPQMFARENLFNAAGKRSKLWIADEIEWDEIQQRVNSWIGHAQ